MSGIDLLDKIKRIITIADIGLLYHKDEYDLERYTELKQLALQMLSDISDQPVQSLESSFPALFDYPTAKVDIRGLILSPDKKILLVKEQSDGCWSLPGGWAEVGFTPSETIVKECKEETGLQVEAKRLLALFDKRKHPHPPEPHYCFKMLFHCDALSREIAKGFDVLDVQYFAVDDLPPLSQNRILQSQIELVYRKIMTGDEVTYFD